MIAALAGGGSQFTAVIAQVECFVFWNRKRPLVGCFCTVVGLQRIAFAHVLGLKIVDQTDEEDPEQQIAALA